ncbi:hypothetical protein BH23ACT3_BH23ACT3_09260 [soil metagenome]
MRPTTPTADVPALGADRQQQAISLIRGFAMDAPLHANS